MIMNTWMLNQIMNSQFPIGSVYPERDPNSWAVLKICIDIKGFKDDLILNFVGNVNIDFKKGLNLNHLVSLLSITICRV